ncbi:hypothetical protein LB565_17790 [Mesorhizobium sp. CA14]|uniref:hypothetical protein n=1 Tax=Mesorhizobium sp. CA14 TaxID=2876642 RepID=UPI001CCD1731|nr:hypothetical protein [Mesorhizobium sp. CA14]MBZ9849840.1 hypothetical protein [Mesorhizobium sp. CA14]
MINAGNAAGRKALRCAFDEAAVLIGRHKAGRLLKAARLSGIKGRHLLLLPFANAVARRAESWVSRLPPGAHYVCSGRV